MSSEMFDSLHRWDCIEIEWEDSHQIHHWTPIEDAEIEDESSLGHRSIGYYLGQTPRQITICSHGKTDAALIATERTNVCGVFTIPKRCVLSVRHMIPRREITPPELTDSANQNPSNGTGEQEQ